MPPLAGPGALLATALLASGCAATKATVHLVQAETAVSHARAENAPELAVYEYTMAIRHLEKAREEAGYADYKDSVGLAKQAAEWADKAIIAIHGEGRALDLEGTPQTVPPPPDAAAPATTVPQPAAGGADAGTPADATPVVVPVPPAPPVTPAAPPAPPAEPVKIRVVVPAPPAEDDEEGEAP